MRHRKRDEKQKRDAFCLSKKQNLSKRHRVSLNRLTKSLNLENDKALEYLESLSLGKILKMLKGALKPNEEPKQGSQRTAKKTKNITIAQAKESFFNQKIGLKETSLNFMRSRFNTISKLLNVKESYRVSKITKESIVNYHNDAFEKYQKNTLINFNALLKSFLKFCEQEGFIDKSPYFKITLKNAKRGLKDEPFSLDEIKTILHHAPNLRLKAFLITAFFTGLRTGEQLALLWSDIDFENKKINIDKSLTPSGITSPKNQTSIRKVDLLEPVERILKELKESEPEGKKMIFLNIPKRTQEFQKAFKKLLKAVNLKEKKLYTTRHTFASLMISMGEEPLWVSKNMGHNDLNVTYANYACYIPQPKKERAAFLKESL